MKPLNHVWRLAVGLFIALALVVPLDVWAQAAPTPQIRNSPKPWIGLMLMILLAVAVVAVSMIPSKRGHQD